MHSPIAINPGLNKKWLALMAQNQYPSDRLERYRSGHNGTDSKSVEGLASYKGSNPFLSAISQFHAVTKYPISLAITVFPSILLSHTARRILGICGQVFRYAMSTDRLTQDVTYSLQGAIPPAKGKHFAAPTEPKQLGDLLKIIDGYDDSIIVSCALRLAPLVFVRPGELRHTKWADIDLATAEWRFTVSKTEVRHLVPLARQSISILREIQQYTGSGVYVFPSARSPQRPMSENAILAALRRLGITKEEATGHGFRATARTLLDEVLGFRPDYIEHQLAHIVRDPNDRAYNRTSHIEERKKIMQAWADYLDTLKSK